jgi:hypothetical protein
VCGGGGGGGVGDLNETVRDLTITNLEYSLARLATGRWVHV